MAEALLDKPPSSRSIGPVRFLCGENDLRSSSVSFVMDTMVVYLSFSKLFRLSILLSLTLFRSLMECDLSHVVLVIIPSMEAWHGPCRWMKSLFYVWLSSALYISLMRSGDGFTRLPEDRYFWIFWKYQPADVIIYVSWSNADSTFSLNEHHPRPAHSAKIWLLWRQRGYVETLS